MSHGHPSQFVLVHMCELLHSPLLTYEFQKKVLSTFTLVFLGMFPTRESCVLHQFRRIVPFCAASLRISLPMITALPMMSVVYSRRLHRGFLFSRSRLLFSMRLVLRVYAPSGFFWLQAPIFFISLYVREGSSLSSWTSLGSVLFARTVRVSFELASLSAYPEVFNILTSSGVSGLLIGWFRLTLRDHVKCLAVIA